MLSIVLVACALNLDAIFIHDIFLWARILIPALLFVGLAGAFTADRMLFILTSIAAWVGIGLFFLVSILTRIPGDFSHLAEATRVASDAFLQKRLLILFALGILVTVLFAQLIKTRRFAGKKTRD